MDHGAPGGAASVIGRPAADTVPAQCQANRSLRGGQVVAAHGWLTLFSDQTLGTPHAPLPRAMADASNQDPGSALPASAFAIESRHRPGAGDLAWLARSFREPEWFWPALQRHLALPSLPPYKSVAGVHYDLYQDLVARHAGGDSVALRFYDRWRGWQALTYAQLHSLCCRQAAAWEAGGLGPGMVLGIALPLGPACAVALLAGLRLGALVSLLPTAGRQHLARSVEGVAPQMIATDAAHAPLLAGAPAPLVMVDALAHVAPVLQPTEAGRSYTFRSGEPCAMLLSPLRRPLHAPVPVRCDDMYLDALRDGALVFALRPGDHLAAPGFHTLQHQPSLLFSALLAGATYVHLDWTDVEREPALLWQIPLRSVGVTPALRDLVLARGPRTRPEWQHWFKNPEEPCDWTAWRDFIELAKLEDVPVSNVLVEAAAGGALLCSVRRPGREQLAYLMNVLPAAGRPWMLLDFNQSGQPAIGDVGVHARIEQDAPVGPQHALLARVAGGEYLFGGNLEPRRAGRIYPRDEVLAAIATLPFVRGGSVVPVLSGGPASHFKLVLLVFCGFCGSDGAPDADTATERARIVAVERAIRDQLGDEHLPDHVILFPLHARRDVKQGVNHDWCQAQYVLGSLFRKSRMPLFRHLTAIRQACLDATASPA